MNDTKKSRKFGCELRRLQIQFPDHFALNAETIAIAIKARKQPARPEQAYLEAGVPMWPLIRVARLLVAI